MADLTEQEAFVAMGLFVQEFYDRARGNDIELLMSDITLEPDGRSSDPAAWEDWLRCVAKAREHR